MKAAGKEKILELRGDLSAHYRADLAKERNILGKKIGEARKKMCITQSELSELLTHFGVNVQTPAVNKWERGDTVPNAYQLITLCHALNIADGLDYFTGPVMPKKETLNAEGQRMLNNYRKFLESQDRYTVPRTVKMIDMLVSLLPASAGFGDFLDDENFETQSFPANSVPDGADFAVPVDGDSMEPLYHNGQLIWIQQCESIDVGDVGLFVIDNHGYVKTYCERMPDEADFENYIDSNGVIHPQVVLISQNKSYEPKVITPEMDFRVVGRVLN